MVNKYFHDSQNKTVYRVDEPSIIENRDRRGRRRSWYTHTEVHITRADNVLTGSEWKYRVFEPRHEYFDRKYSKEDVIEYFMSRVYPQDCVEISFEEYELLQRQYEPDARNNHLA